MHFIKKEKNRYEIRKQVAQCKPRVVDTQAPEQHMLPPLVEQPVRELALAARTRARTRFCQRGARGFGRSRGGVYEDRADLRDPNPSF